MKLKQLVAYICNSKPYELNLTNLSAKIGINRKTLYLYIHYLTLGDIFMKADDIEVGFGNKIPLWLFGFLY